MQDSEARPANPELKELVVEASHALARLDAARLEELVLSCQALTRTLNPKETRVRKLFAGQARETAKPTWRFLRMCSKQRAPI